MIIEIEPLATVGWKWGCQPCSWPMLAKWNALLKGDLSFGSACLLKKSIPAIPFRNSKHPLPGRSNFLTAAARSTSSALGLQKIPSLRCSCRKTCLMQRSRGFGHGVVVAANQWGTNCLEWAFSISGLEVGLPALQLPMLAKCEALRKGDLLDMFVRGSIPAIPVWNSKHPIPTRSLMFLRAQHAWLALRFCIMPIPSLQLQKIAPVSCREAKRLVTQSWSPRFVTNAVIIQFLNYNHYLVQMIHVHKIHYYLKKHDLPVKPICGVTCSW